MKRLVYLLSALLALPLPALAGSVKIVGSGGGSGTAGTLVDDISCGANQYLQRNGTDTGWACSTGTATGDSVSVDGGPTTDPNFDDGGDINFTNTANTITATVKSSTITAAKMANADHGDVSWSGGVATVEDLTCTDCIGATEITDIYMLNTGDAGTGAWDFTGASSFRILSTTSCTALTSEASLCWDSDDDHLYVGTGAAAQQIDGAGGGGAPTDADYLVGTANGTLSNEIAVGTTPGGELGGTWASPTLDDGVSVATWTLTASTLITPTITTSVDIGTAGVRLSDNADGGLTFLGLGNGFDESLTFDFDNTTNEVTITSSTGVTTVNFPDNSIPLADIQPSDGQLLNLSVINNSGTGEGLRLPQAANCTAGTAEGQICWDTDDDQLVVGSGLSTVTISGGGTGDVNAVGDCASGSCFTGSTGTTLSSNTDLIMDIDDDNNGTESFQVRNGGNTVVLEMTEAAGLFVDVLDLAGPSGTATGTINNLDAIDSTTETTIENAIDTLNNLVTVGTITSGTWNAGAVTSSGAVSTATLTLTGTGTINGLDAMDATTEATIEGQVFDADAQNITGVWEVQDGINFVFGNDADWKAQYEGTTRDQLLLTTTRTAATAIGDPMFQIMTDFGTASGTNLTANQQVFGIAKGTSATNVDLLTLDAEGDLVVAGTISSAPQAIPTVEFRDSSAADGDVNARIYADCTDTGSGTEDCDLTLAQQEAGAEKNILVADADGGITMGSAGTNDFTITTDGSGNAEVVLPTDSIGTGEILDNTITATDIAATVTFADGDVLNFGSVSVSTTNEGLILPGHATDCSTAGTTEGQVCWEADSDTLYIGNGATVTAIGAGADVSAVGNCASGACFGGASGTPLTSTTSEVLDMGTDATFIYTRNDAGAVTFAGADNASPADTIYDTTGAGAITVGSADVTSVTITTDSTGDAEVILPTGSIGAGEILNDSIDFSDILIGASPPALMAAGDVWFIQNGIAFEGATGGANTNELTLTIAGDPGSDITVTLPLTTGTVITTGDTNTVTSAMIATEVRSMWFGAAGLSVDGTNCATPSEVTINSGPKLFTIICADNDSSTIYGSTTMPDSWDGGTVTFAQVYIQTAADTNALNGDIAAQCRGNGEVPSSTWGTEVAIDDAAVVGSNSNDITVSGAVTPAGTCAAGDVLYWRYQLDAAGTTTAVATLHTLGFKMEYTSNVGD